MAVAVVQSKHQVIASLGTTPTHVAFTTPPSVGNVVFAIVACDNNVPLLRPTNGDWNGWCCDHNSVGVNQFAVWWKEVMTEGSPQGSYAFTRNTGSARASVLLIELSGADAANPLMMCDEREGSGVNPVNYEFETEKSGINLLAITYDGTGTMPTSPADGSPAEWTEIVDSNGADPNLWVGYATSKVGGTFNTFGCTLSVSSNWATFGLHIRQAEATAAATNQMYKGLGIRQVAYQAIDDLATWTVSFPRQPLNGSLLVAYLVNRANVTVTPPGGNWQIQQDTAAGDKRWFATRKCGASEPLSYAWTVSTAGDWCVVMLELTGVQYIASPNFARYVSATDTETVPLFSSIGGAAGAEAALCLYAREASAMVDPTVLQQVAKNVGFRVIGVYGVPGLCYSIFAATYDIQLRSPPDFSSTANERAFRTTGALNRAHAVLGLYSEFSATSPTPPPVLSGGASGGGGGVRRLRSQGVICFHDAAIEARARRHAHADLARRDSRHRGDRPEPQRRATRIGARAGARHRDQ